MTAVCVLIVGCEMLAAGRMLMTRHKAKRSARKSLDERIHAGQSRTESGDERLTHLEHRLELDDLDYRHLDRHAAFYENRIVAAQVRGLCRMLNMDQSARFVE